MVLSRLRGMGVAETERPRLPVSADAPATFPELIELNRRTYGPKVAFQQKARGTWQRLTHDEVARRSYDIAAGLIALGLHHGDRVAIVAENSIDWALSYYAIVTAGGVAVPVYYDLNPAEIAEMVGRSGARMAVLSQRSLARLRAHMTELRVILVAGDQPPPSDALPSDLSPVDQPDVLALADVPGRATPSSRDRLAATVVAPDDLASIVFTSGTAGGMKGVMLSHRNFMANMHSVRRSIPFTPKDRIVMVLPMHHAFPFIVGIAVSPAVGGELTFENDLRRIRDRMAEVKPTLFLGVPQLFEVMYRNIVHGIEAQGRLENFERGLRIVEATKARTGVNIGRIVFRELHKRLGGSLRFMVSGGAALNPQVAKNFARLGVPIVQGWGLTESAPVISVQRWSPRKFYLSSYYEEHVGTVGTPLEGVEVALIDVPEKELYVHLHGEGELIVRGDNISPGYWQGEDATRAARVGEWLRTGDVGSIDDEGNIWITGRSKFVIVLDSGEKIHPDELEEKLGRSSAIEDLAVIGRKVRGKTQAWAIVYPNRDEITARLEGAPLTEAAVRAIIKAEIDAAEHDIAAYKRISDFMLSDIPLPRTRPLRKIARGQIADTYSFDVRNWEPSWTEHLAALAPAPESDDTAEGAAAS